MIKRKYEELVARFKDDDEMLEFIKERMQYICRYVESVTAMEYSMPLLRARFEGQELREKIENLDRNRRISHEAAISAVKQLNRLCVSEGVEKLYSGDEENRYEIGDFCGEVVNTLFEGRTR